MIGTLQSPSPLQGFIDKWLAAQPQQQVALAFVDGRTCPGHLALAALEQEIVDAAYGLREPQAVVAKLHWWVAELSGAAASGGQHPLTQVMFFESRARAIPVSVWTAPALAAVAQLEQGTPADFAAQLAAARPLHVALATLETAWWYGPAAGAQRAGEMAVLAHLLHSLRRLPQDVDRDRLALPMDRMAQFGLVREQLRRPGSQRDAAVKAQLQDLRVRWRSAARMAGPLSVFRALEAQQGRRLARRAAGAADSLQALADRAPRPGLLLPLHVWAAARAWQRQRPRSPAATAAGGAAPL